MGLYTTPDCQVEIKNNEYIIRNSLVGRGEVRTKQPVEARNILLSISSFGDQIPWKALDIIKERIK